MAFFFCSYFGVVGSEREIRGFGKLPKGLPQQAKPVRVQAILTNKP